MSPTMMASEAKWKSKDKKGGTKEAMTKALIKPDVNEAPADNLGASTGDRRWNDTQISQEV